MKYVFVVNPMAGNDNQRRIFSRIKSAFRQVDDEMIIEERTDRVTQNILQAVMPKNTAKIV